MEHSQRVRIADNEDIRIAKHTYARRVSALYRIDQFACRVSTILTRLDSQMAQYAMPAASYMGLGRVPAETRL
jgi:hypothetical protein